MSGSNGVGTAELPRLNPATIVDARKLTLVIDEFVAADPADLEHREVIAGLRTELRGLVTEEAAEVLVRFDRAVGTRHGDLAVALLQWGFTEGLRYAGHDARGGGR